MNQNQPQAALAVRETQSPAVAFSVPDLMTMAKQIAVSGLFAAIKTPEQAFTLMMLCQAENLHPVQALRRYHILNGRPTMRADAIQAEFQRRGGHVEFHVRDDARCSATFTHPAASAVKVDWDMDRAKKAGVLGNPTWQKYPRAMLHARVVSEGVRAVLPEVLVGIYTPEEIQDVETTVPKRRAGKSAPAASTDAAPEPDAPKAVTEIKAAPADSNWRETRVHFGKNKGMKIDELSPNQVHWYETEWMVKKEAGGIVTGDDVALIEALKANRDEREMLARKNAPAPADQGDELDMAPVPAAAVVTPTNWRDTIVHNGPSEGHRLGDNLGDNPLVTLQKMRAWFEEHPPMDKPAKRIAAAVALGVAELEKTDLRDQPIPFDEGEGETVVEVEGQEVAA